MKSSSNISQSEELTPIAKAILPLSASLAKTKRLCNVIRILIAIGAAVFFVGYTIIWGLVLTLAIQNGLDSASGVSLASFLLMGICEAFGALLAYRIFADLVRNEAIFTMPQIRRLKGIALVFVALFAIELIFPTSSIFMLGAEEGFVGLVNDSTAIPSMPRLNLSSLLFAAVFYCASAIFEYASLLQQASDETI